MIVVVSLILAFLLLCTLINYLFNMFDAIFYRHRNNSTEKGRNSTQLLSHSIKRIDIVFLSHEIESFNASIKYSIMCVCVTPIVSLTE